MVWSLSIVFEEDGEAYGVDRRRFQPSNDMTNILFLLKFPS